MKPVAIADFFWIFFIIAALLPWLKQKQIESARYRLIRMIETGRRSRLITLIHRQESMSILGFLLSRFINIEDSEQVLRAIRLTPDEMPIDMVLHTPGGLVLASEQIAHALENHPSKVTVFVPHYAMSGGTLLALAADEIIMSEHAVLGPVDPQIGQFPAASLLRAVAKKPVAEVDDNTLIMADQAEKAIAQVRNSVLELLENKFSPEKANELARLLTGGTWTHDFAITFEAAQVLGLPVSSEMPKEILELMSLFPQPTRQIPAVEYIPFPRRPKP